MYGDLQVERARENDSDAITYLEKEMVRNILDIWYLQRGDRRYELHVCRVGSEVRAHLGIYSCPEAVYVGLGGESYAAEVLLPLVPSKALLTVTPTLHDLVTRKLRFDAKYHTDNMMVRKGEEKLQDSDSAKRLSREHDVEYATFGSSFNLREMTLEWAREQLDNDIVFGTFANCKLASVASLVAWLPQIAAITGVETKPQFRKRGLGGITVSGDGSFSR